MLTTTRQLIGRNLSENSCSLTWIDINSRLTLFYDSIYVIFCGSFNVLDVRKMYLTGKNVD